MDKLKAALVYKFWMLLGVALLVPFIGWWMATSAISGQVEERMKKVDGAFSGLTASGENPNEKWTVQIKKYMGVQEVAVLQAHERLFEKQKDLLIWPDGLSWQTGTIPTEAQITQKDIDYYRNLHDGLIEEVHQIPKPIDFETGVGLVDFPIERLPHSDFSKFPPRKDEIIQTREDMWLFSVLLSAIARVNDEAKAKIQLEAPIRQILKIELRGGRARGPAALGGEAAAGGSAEGTAGPGIASVGTAGGHDAGSMGGMLGMMGGADASMGGMGGMRGGDGGGGGASVEFDPSEDFGSDSEGGGAAASAMGGMPGSSPPASAAAGPGGGHADTGDAGAFGGGGAGGTKGKKYIEDTPKYKTRGFYLSVTMNHSKLPHLLTELSNSPWPIRVMRVQQADLHMQDLAAVVATGGAAPQFSRGTASGGSSPLSMRSFGSAGGTAMAPPGGEEGVGGAEGAAGFTSALDDPLLVHVALCGFFTIYKPPTAPQSAGATPVGTTPETPAAPSAAGSASSPLAGAPQPAAGPENQPATTSTAGTPAAAETTPPSSTKPTGDASKPSATPADESQKKPEPSAPESPEKPASNTKPSDEKPTEAPAEKPKAPTG